MYFIDGKIAKTCKDLNDVAKAKVADVGPIYFAKGNYKSVQEAQNPSIVWQPYRQGEECAKRDDHAWFKFQVEIPPELEGKSLSLYVTSYHKGWDATNPQFIVYINGQLTQGVDVNHTRILLAHQAKAGDLYQVDVHGYSGMISGQSFFSPELLEVFEDVVNLYYDIKVPLDITSFMDENDKSKHDMLTVLNETNNIIDIRKHGSALFYDSVKKARSFIQ